jgi:hypothetical protein
VSRQVPAASLRPNMSWAAVASGSWCGSIAAHPPVSWPGLSRPPTTSHQRDRKIIPFGISGDNQTDLPSTWPPFQACFALDGRDHVFVLFSVNQAVQLVPAGECRSEPSLMLPDTAGEITGHAEVQRPIRSIGHDVDPAGRHGEDNQRERLRNGLRLAAHRHSHWGGPREVVGGRAKPGHDTNARVGHDTNATTGHDTNATAGHDTNATAGHDAGETFGRDDEPRPAIPSGCGWSPR